MRNTTATILLGTLLVVTACGGKEETANTAKPVAAPTPPPASTPAQSAHGQIQGNMPRISMSLSLAGVTLDIVAQGTLKPMSRYRIDLALLAGAPGAVVRVWIGDESGVGSAKSKANGHGDHYHASAIVPKEINEKTALWIEVQSVTGDRESGRIALQ